MWAIGYREISWWYWTATAALLWSGLTFWQLALLLATMLSAFQTAHFGPRERRLGAFPV